MALAARAGRRPPRSAAWLIRPIACLLGVMAICALLAGVLGWLLARGGTVVLVGRLAARVPCERHVAFMADLWAHSASYLAGLVGGLALVVIVWRSRHEVDRGAAVYPPQGG